MTTRAEDIAAIRKLADAWQAGWLEGDAQALVAMYADDPVLMPQGQASITAKDEILASYQSVFDDYTVEGGGEVLEIEAAGDWGFFRSTYALKAVPRGGGEPIEDEGKSLFIVRRQTDGSWKIARLISNSDL
ncbi:MAG: SgcJ/EcaC family oxidoreductase [Thermoguttaceae bacterium]|nr:SgcJ/EcaC family oxidoreductase [Thermoguttaceae bacterium]